MKHTCILAIALVIVFSVPTSQTAHAQSSPLLGQLMPVAFNYCPVGWARADGQILAIVDNSALFALLGTTYGGDGRTTFALPDLRGRVPIHNGTGPGLNSYPLGSIGGQELVTLNQLQMPSHDHTITELQNANGSTDGLVIRNGSGATPVGTSSTGGGQAHENRPPYLSVQWCIAIIGTFPSRN